MPRHYIKILGWLEPYYAKVAPAAHDWTQQLFDDISEHGSELAVVNLPPSFKGSRVGLCGERFFCEAGLDRDRPDTLFIHRIESAELRLPQEIPRRVVGEFQLVTAPVDNLPDRDPFAALLESQAKLPPPRPPTHPEEPPPAKLVQPPASKRLADLLAVAPADLRRAWRPARPTEAPPSAAELVALVRKPWSRFRLDRHATIDPREENILSGRITPGDLPLDRRSKLLGIFSMGLLNSFVADPATNAEALQRLLELLGAAGDLPIRPEVFSGMLAGLDPTALRRDLAEISAESSWIASDPAATAEWTVPLIGALKRAAARAGDEGLAQILRQADAETNPLAAILGWAGRLQVQPDRQEAIAAPEAPRPISLAAPILADPGASVAAADLEAASPLDGGASVLDTWVLRLRLPQPRLLAKTVQELQSEAKHFAAARLDFTTAAGIEAAVSSLRSLSETIQGVVRDLPSPDLFESDLGEARKAYAEAREVLGGQVDLLVESHEGLSPRDLGEITTVIRREEFLRFLPPWLFRAEDPDGELVDRDRDGLLETAARLVDREVRSRVLKAIEVIEGAEDCLPLLSGVSPPPEEEDLGKYLRDLLDQLRSAPVELRGWHQEMLAKGDNPQILRRVVDRLMGLQARLSVETFAALLGALGAGPDAVSRERLLLRYQAAVTSFEQMLGTAHTTTAELLQQWITNNPAAFAGAPGALAADVSFEHNFTEAKRGRVKLPFLPNPNAPAREYGVVQAPVLVTSAYPDALLLGLRVEVKSTRHAGLHSGWGSPQPQELAIKESDWRRSADDKGFQYAFRLELPVRRPTSANESLEAAIAAFNPERKRIVGSEKLLRWEEFDLAPQQIVLNWRDGVNPSYVRSHPVGAQARIERIRSRIRNGNSFAVMAPRRFGKTTLVDFLYREAASEKILAPEPVVCTSHFARGRLDYDKVWEELSERLQKLVGAAMAKTTGPLPEASGFDYVRAAAARSGYRSILVLFDEAQLLFPRQGGYEIGDRLKDLLERSWSHLDTAGMVPVLFGLIGLPSLRKRAGVNLTTMLNPLEASALDESEINRIILSVTADRLQTTRDARLKLAAIAPNLSLLRTLFDAVVDRLNAEQRPWANINDIEDAEQDYLRRLKQGEEGQIGSVVRDALNEAETVNEWRPAASFPVALALAAARFERRRDAPDPRGRLVETLNQWCAVYQPTITSLRFDETIVEERLEELSESGVYKDGQFSSLFLEAWLVGQGRNGYPTDARDALVRGAMQRVRKPEALEVLDGGAQARLLRFSDADGNLFAYRRVELGSDDERNRFVESIASLGALTKGSSKMEVGAQYLFDLVAVGLSEEDERVGIQVYRWIEGHDLQQEVRQMSAALVAEIGYKLALALKLLGKRGILHRDIRPRNIILSHKHKDPVLIDFGLARLDSESMNTVIAGEYAAPEVQQVNPRWTRAADVYSLGKTLQSLLVEEGDRHGLAETIAACTSADPGRRPTADKLATLLDDVRRKEGVEELQNRCWRHLVDSVGDDFGKRWFQNVVDKFAPRFKYFVLGDRKQDAERQLVLADFLNQVLEAVPRTRDEPQLSLGYLKNKVPRFATAAIERVHQLRRHYSHGDQTRYEGRVRRIAQEVEQDRVHLSDAAAAIGEFVRLDSLPLIVDAILKSES